MFDSPDLGIFQSLFSVQFCDSRKASRQENSRFEGLKEILWGWNMKCEGILVRDAAGEVCGDQVMQDIFSWLRHLDFILKAERSYRRIFSERHDMLRYTY